MCLLQRRQGLFVFFIILFFFYTPNLFAAKAYEYSSIGFYDAEHTGNNGVQESMFSFMAPSRNSDYLFGLSSGYNGGAVSLYRTYWVYNSLNFEITKVGLYGAEYTKDDGLRSTTVQVTNDNGYAGGISWEFSGATSLGVATWLGGGPRGLNIKVGGYDAKHTKNNGGHQGDVWGIIDTGYASGYSAVFNGGASVLGYSFWLYNLNNNTQSFIGLFDAEHTRNDGVQDSGKDVCDMTESGYIPGISTRYNGGAISLGTTSWIYRVSDGVLREVGFYDAEHTKDNLFQFSRLNSITESGYAYGYSYRYNGGAADLGRTEWVYDFPNVNQSKVGFYDAEHTRNDGYQYSMTEGITESGYVYGYSNRYEGGGSQLRQSAWVYDIPNAVQAKVGIYDLEHTKADGTKYSKVERVTESGYVSGFSWRYTGDDPKGQSAWVYDIPNVNQVKVGFYDADHTSDTGRKYSVVEGITESGYAYGGSHVFMGGASALGKSCWVYDIPNATQIKVGLLDGEHTSDVGVNSSGIYYVTENGYACGTSNRYNGGGVVLGNTSWVYNILNSIYSEIGIYDAEHTRNDGYQSSGLVIYGDAIDAGYTGGFSSRYNGGGGDLGITAWVYDIANNLQTEVGVYDAEHTRNDGYKYSLVDKTTVTGYASGYSHRYNGGAIQLKQTAWLSHIPTGRQRVFNFGQDVDTGYGWSSIKILLENGTALGVFGHIDGAGHIDGERIFKGTIDGEEDLFEVVGGDILSYHFSENHLHIFVLRDEEMIAGFGRLWNVFHPEGGIVSFLLVYKDTEVFTPAAENDNQASLAKVLDAPASYVGDNAVFYQYLLNYSTGGNVDETLQQMLPQASSYASNVGVGSMQLVLDTVSSNNFSSLSGTTTPDNSVQGQLNQETSGFGNIDASIYGKYIYSKGSQNGDVEHNGYEYNSNGVTFGADFEKGDSGFFGLAIGYLDTDVDGEKNTGDIEQTSFSPNIYMALSRDKWKINIGGGYGFLQNDSKRFCGINEIGEVSAKWDAHAFTVFSGVSYNFCKAKDIACDFVGGFDYMTMHSKSYTEKGADLWDMEIASNDTNSLRSRFGIVLANDKDFSNKIKLSTQLRAFWIHSYLNENTTTVNSFNGSSSFNINGLSQDRDKLQLGISFNAAVSDIMEIFLTYDNQLSENAEQHEINLGIRYGF